MTSDVHIIEGGLDDDRVIALLTTHRTRARAQTAPGSAHALDLAGLRAPDVAFWSGWIDDAPVAVGALRTLDDAHGEIKSMYVDESQRGRGLGGVMVEHLVAAARARGMTRVSLETGSWPYFAPARALYASHGFAECAPFGDYRPDRNSVFMSRAV